MKPHESSTNTLIAALRILARDIQSGDGVANATIAEAADRMEQMDKLLRFAVDIVAYPTSTPDMTSAQWLVRAKGVGITPCPF